MVNNKILLLKHEMDINLKPIYLENENYRPHDETISFDMHMISKYCKSFPTCDGCEFKQEHWGCYFKGRTPREW